MELKRRRDILRTHGDLSRVETRLGLVVEGGGMRGVISGGSLIALEQLGLTSAFDEVYGESAGAINAAYFLASQAAFGGRIYVEDLTSVRFISPWRLNKILDMDFVVDHVMTHVKPLNAEAVLRSRSSLFVSVTNALDGTGRIVDVKKEQPPLLPLLKATAAITPLYNKAVLLEGVPYVDGGITDPIPVANAVKAGCTHILVLLTRPYGFRSRASRGIERRLLQILLRHWDPRFRHVFLNVRYRKYNEARAIAFGETAQPSTPEIAVICPDGLGVSVTRTTIRRAVLEDAMGGGIENTLSLFA